MHNIQEVGAGQLEEVLTFVNNNWIELSKRPQAKPEERELSYWKENLRSQRVLIFRRDDGEIQGLLTFSRKGNELWLNHFLVHPSCRGQGIGFKLLQMVERFAQAWEAKRIILEGREDQAEYLPYFERRGYVFHCPVLEKGHITVEKRL